MAIERPQLYAFLLPFTFVSLIIYAQILLEIYRKRKSIYDGFFFRMICSQSIYDISYVVMYFIMELPADFRALDGFYLGMTGVLPQLIYAHIYWCQIAQIIGVTIMAISRMMLVCHPVFKISRMMKKLSIKQVVFFHLLIPTCYALYIIFGHGWRYYWYTTRPVDKTRRIYRYGKDTGESATINSYVLCGFGMAGSFLSAVCYVRIFLTLRKRPLRTWSSDIYILATSFVLFCALCIITAFFITNIIVRSSNEYKQGGLLYYYLRDHSYAFTFLLSLANPLYPSLRPSPLSSLLLFSPAALRLNQSFEYHSPSGSTHDYCFYSDTKDINYPPIHLLDYMEPINLATDDLMTIRARMFTILEESKGRRFATPEFCQFYLDIYTLHCSHEDNCKIRHGNLSVDEKMRKKKKSVHTLKLESCLVPTFGAVVILYGH